MGIHLEQSKTSSVIRLQGAIDIASGVELKKLLLRACRSGKKITVVLDEATDLDVIAVQFIWAARRSAQAAGLEFALSGAVPESVLSALDDTGLRHFLVPFDAQLIKGAADC